MLTTTILSCYFPDMERRTLANTVAQNVSDAIAAAGVSPSVVAQAADLTVPALKARLVGDVEFNVPELVLVGGFLRIRPSAFLGAVA